MATTDKPTTMDDVVKEIERFNTQIASLDEFQITAYRHDDDDTKYPESKKIRDAVDSLRNVFNAYSQANTNDKTAKIIAWMNEALEKAGTNLRSRRVDANSIGLAHDLAAIIRVYREKKPDDVDKSFAEAMTKLAEASWLKTGLEYIYIMLGGTRLSVNHGLQILKPTRRLQPMLSKKRQCVGCTEIFNRYKHLKVIQ